MADTDTHTTEFTDWELLQSTAPDSRLIRSDYFSLPPNNNKPPSSPNSHGEIEREGEGVNEEEGSEEKRKNEGELGKKRSGGGVWEIVKYCLYKVKAASASASAWYVSLAGAMFLGLVWIARRRMLMHRIKEHNTSASLHPSIDAKRVTKYAVRAVHVNEALKHVPILRPSPLAAGIIPISLLAFR